VIVYVDELVDECVDECVYESESLYIVYMVYVDECVFESEGVCRLCTWCMLVNGRPQCKLMVYCYM